MKATPLISIAALVAALAVTPTLSFGANVGVNIGGGADVSVGNGSVDVNAGLGADVGANGGAAGGVSTGSSLDANAQLDVLLNLLADADYNAGSFSAWTDGSADATTVIKTHDLFDADALARIDAAVAANASEQSDLKAAIDANASLKAWLDANGIDASSVIAINVNAQGSVEVYEG